MGTDVNLGKGNSFLPVPCKAFMPDTGYEFIVVKDASWQGFTKVRVKSYFKVWPKYSVIWDTK